MPKNESQWPFMSVVLDQVLEEYCPNLLTIDEATELFRRFDYDKNNALDYRELQHFNAYIFKHFPRAGENETEKSTTTITKSTPRTTEVGGEGNEQVELNLEFCGLPSRMFFVCYNLTYLDLSFQVCFHKKKQNSNKKYKFLF